MGKNITVKLPGQAPVSLTAGFCSPCEAQALQEQTAAVQKTYQNNEAFAAAGADLDTSHEVPWSGEIGFENQFTGDGRYINKGALRWEESQMPMPLRWAPSDIGSHGGAVVVGLITEMEVKGDKVLAKGFIDSSTEAGFKVIEGMRSGLIKGVSMDLDEMSFEIRVKEEVLREFEEEMEELEKAILEGEELPEEPKEKADENGYVKVYEQEALTEVMYVTDALVRAATLVDIPAFKDAYVALDEPDVEPTKDTNAPAAVTAAAPLAPSSAWFANPNFSAPQPITISADGHIRGHIALWGTCHTGFSNTCVTAPPSHTNYALFRTGVLLTAEGDEVAVGRITMDTGHAALSMGAGPASAHYDNTGTAVADVTSGEDSHGIWISGALRSDVSEEKLRALRSSPMSGDWRSSGGQLELVGVLAVNLPGFPVPRVSAMVASGRTASLIRPTEAPVVVEEKPYVPSAVEVFNKNARQLRRQQWAAKVGE